VKSCAEIIASIMSEAEAVISKMSTFRQKA
jgi:hypothetical protein